jgi:hypothetical protein
MMNMWQYWHAGWLKIIRASLCFWSSVGRPLGAVYYLPLHTLFDLHPKPYRVTTITLVAAAIPIAYLLGRSLSTPRLAAFLAALAWCYHPRLSNLVFLNSFIYDVLCNLFYFAALAIYIGIRERGQFLRPLQLFGCLVLYICALNSKEMGVTLPVIILVYELLKYYHQPERQNLDHRIWRAASPALLGGLITAIYCYSKIYGTESWALRGIDVYIPHYSWHSFITSNAAFFSHIFYLLPNHPALGWQLLVVWLLVFLYAFLQRDRVLELMAFWVVITPLPLAFVSPREGACLTIILFGWAMILAKLVSDASYFITEWPWLGRSARRYMRASLALCAIILLGVTTERQNRRYGLGWLKGGEKTGHVIEAFRALSLHPKSGSKILLTDNPLAGSPGTAVWAPRFIADLLWDDHSLMIYQERQNPLSSEQVAEMDYVLAVHENEIEIIRGPR